MTEIRYEYCRGKYRHYIQDIEKDGAWREGHIGTYGEFDLDKITELLNKFDSENKRLKIKNKGLQSELEIFKGDLEITNKECYKLHDENQQLRKFIMDLQNMIQFDVDNGIKTYPKKLSEYLANALKVIE